MIDDNTIQRWQFCLLDCTGNCQYVDARGRKVRLVHVDYAGTCDEANAEAKRRAQLYLERTGTTVVRMELILQGDVK